jgi:glutamine synthetase
MVERCWAGVFQCWGVQNRECPLRLVPTNFELKAMDNTCNPYVALGAIIAAGRDGLNRGMQLGPPVEGDPVDGQDVGDRLPTTLRMALDALEQDKVIKDAMGSELLATYMSVTREKLRYLSTLDRQQVDMIQART